MELKDFFEQVNKPLDQEILRNLKTAKLPTSDALHQMLLYHHGWEDGRKVSGAAGKRIRPIMLLLVVDAFGEDWENALPAAAAIELLHNFSLIHDDIEDRSETRRGRKTVWKKWGEPQAINTGDALFSIANLALLNLRDTYSKKQVQSVGKVFLKACLNLTKGQFLDISFETRYDITCEQYWEMINGKTAELLAASCQIGAILAKAPKANRKAITKFGRYLGLAFQIKDDVLGIWGETKKIGKSSSSDIVSGKKTLPILYGLEQDGEFAKLYNSLKSDFSRDERLNELIETLTESGAKLFAEAEVERLTQTALDGLHKALPAENRKNLEALAKMLLNRDF